LTRIECCPSRSLQQRPIDAEVIESILDAAVTEFKRFSADDAAAAALRLVTGRGRASNNWIKDSYTDLRPQTQRCCEAALSRLGKNGESVKAYMIFDALLAAVHQIAADEDDHGSATLRSNYVSALALIWKAAGLDPTRAYREDDSSYTSRFHRHADLILTAVAEPWVERHRDDLEHSRWLTDEAPASIPLEYRAYVTPPPSETGWLITVHILRKGLSEFKKQLSKRHMTEPSHRATDPTLEG
jgi:hypothetical protein